MTWIETCNWFHIFAVGKLTETASFVNMFSPSIYTYISFKRKKMTARAEAFQPGHLTWRALAWCRHWVPYVRADCTMHNKSTINSQQIRQIESEHKWLDFEQMLRECCVSFGCWNFTRTSSNMFKVWLEFLNRPWCFFETSSSLFSIKICENRVRFDRVIDKILHLTRQCVL